MELLELKLSDEILRSNIKLNTTYLQLKEVLKLLSQKEISDELIAKLNHEISQLNSTTLVGAPLLHVLKKKQSKLLQLVEKEAKLVPINHYRNIWLALGMSAFGIPLGMVFGFGLGNMAYLGIGLPIGLAIGMAVGSAMDKKAKEEARQLDIEIK